MGEGELRVVELFSGVGGFRCGVDAALSDLGLRGTSSALPPPNTNPLSGCVVGAMDLCPAANAVYAHNFAHPLPRCVNIGSEARKGALFHLPADLWTLSPPCQPFTRLGSRKDVRDPRAASLVEVLNALEQWPPPSVAPPRPRWIMLENVRGFDESEMHENAVRVLTGAGYDVRGVVVCPTALGIPNSRSRFFILARAHPFTWAEMQPTLLGVNPHTPVAPLSTYLEKEGEVGEGYVLSPELVCGHGGVMDMVCPRDNHSCCFTRSYGKLARGTGSVLSTQTQLNPQEVREEHARVCPRRGSTRDDDAPPCPMEELKVSAHHTPPTQCSLQWQLRYFTPREVAALHHFPSSFSFPAHVTPRQRWKFLGNSLNVEVVRRLLRVLLSDAPHLGE